jgi:hypothetical protein
MDDLDQRVKTESANRRDASSRLRAMIRACLAVATVDREFWTVFMALWGESLHDPALASINKAAYQRARNAIGGIIEQGVRDGDFKPVNIVHASAMVLALIDGMSLQFTFDKNLMTVRKAERLCEEVLFAHIGK